MTSSHENVSVLIKRDIELEMTPKPPVCFGQCHLWMDQCFTSGFMDMNIVPVILRQYPFLEFFFAACKITFEQGCGHI